MSRPRWSRFLPDRSQLFLLSLGLLALLTVGSFVGLAVEKSAAQAQLDDAEARLKTGKQQEDMLRDSLEPAQRGQNTGPLAGGDFGLAPPGSTEVRPAPVPETDASGRLPVGAPPYWLQWWERLTQP